MKLNIFKEDREVASEKEVYLRFKYHSNGKVVVCACDKEGATMVCGNLIVFYPDGTVKKMFAVNRELGFQLNTDGCIKG